MAEETTPTRQETVEANMAAIVAAFGEGAERKMLVQCAKDINISLAMLVDAGATETTTTTEVEGDS